MAAPLTIWSVCEDRDGQGQGRRHINRVIQNETATDRLLRHPEYNGKRVVITSISGPARCGKSFLLNYLLRYLKAPNKTDWVSDPGEPLTGFSWGKSTRPVTKGIQAWSEPFLVRLEDGEEVVVILMDTEGAFDMEVSFAQCSKLSALSAYISSMLIYNLQGRLQQILFTYLRYFTDYGKIAAGTGSCENTLCQQLTFLIRDWVNDDEFDHGWGGGEEYLAQIMKVSQDAPQELNETKINLCKTFSRLNCFLMRHPTTDVTSSTNFTGQWDQVPPDFATDLKQFVETFFSETNLKVKCLDGQDVLWENLPDVFRFITSAFNRDDLPDPESLVSMTSRLKTKLVLDACIAIYSAHMNQVNFSAHEGLQLRLFEEEHNEGLQKAIEHLQSKLPENIAQRAQKTLKEDIEKCKKPYLENFHLHLGRLLIDECTAIYSNHMSEIDYSSYDNLRLQDFMEQHDQALGKAHEHLLANIPFSETEAWKQILDEHVNECSKPYLENFYLNLQIAQTKYNETLLEDCASEFILTLPLKSKDFDPASTIKQQFQEALRGDENMKADFRAKFEEKLLNIETYHKKSKCSEYSKRYDFFTRWKTKATKEQTLFAIFLRDRMWSQINWDTHASELRKLITFVLLGDINIKEDKDKEKYIDFLLSRLREYSFKEQSGSVLRFAILFVYGMDDKCLRTAIYPVFRIQKGDGRSAKDSYFLDHCGRLYQNWEAYLSENLLDGHWLMAPENGEYLTGEDAGAKLILNDQRRRNLVWKRVDLSVNIGGTACAAAAVGSLVTTALFPPAAFVTVPLGIASAVGCGATGAYGTARCIAKLVEKKKHGEDMTSPSSLAQWASLSLNLVTTVAGGVSSVLSTVRVLRALSFGFEMIVVSVLGAADGVVNLVTNAVVPTNKWSKEKVQKANALLLLLTNYHLPEDSPNFEDLYGDITNTCMKKSEENPNREFVRELGYL